MILAAAIRQDGVVYTLPAPARHHDIICFMALDLGMPTPITGKQGFLDSELGFVDRIQGAAIAIGGGQIKELNWPPNLFSEDLW